MLPDVVGGGAVGVALLIVAGLALYLAAYLILGKWLERKVVQVDPARPTPAHRLGDGVDFVPSDRFVLFGHHFASIAGAAPIIGPVIAMMWGWLPGLLWVWFGNIFVGAVHDYLALMASVRHDGHSVQWIAARIIRPRTGMAFALFVMFALVLIVAAFGAIIAHMFETKPGVATASGLLILAALVLGVLMYRTSLPFWLSTVIGLVMLAGCIGLGLQFPLSLSYSAWLAIFFVYIVVAASIPVNILLQPRDYLNAWLLAVGLVLGAGALLLSREPLALPAVTSFSVPLSMGGGVVVGAVPFWPVIPLIVACGSLSGFHALVGSGTTSKQLNKESCGLVVGYGSMFTEGFLSTVVVATVAGFAVTQVEGLREAALQGGQAFIDQYAQLLGDQGPVVIFAQAYGAVVSRAFGLPQAVVVVLAAMWVASFALTTLDTTNRLARYTWAELMEPLRRRSARVGRFLSHTWIAATVPAALGLGLAWSGSYAMIWPAFGGANQMLASVAMLTSAVWVARELRTIKAWPIVVPALLLWLTVSLALAWYLVVVIPAYAVERTFQAWVLGGAVALMLSLNLLLLWDFAQRMWGDSSR
jgi:carbon starvation protein